MMPGRPAPARSRISLGQREAVQVGHVRIDQHQADTALAVAVGLAHQLASASSPLPTTVGSHIPVAPASRQDPPVGGVVVHHQHPHVVQAGRRGVGCWPRSSAAARSAR